MLITLSCEGVKVLAMASGTASPSLQGSTETEGSIKPESSEWNQYDFALFMNIV